MTRQEIQSPTGFMSGDQTSRHSRDSVSTSFDITEAEHASALVVSRKYARRYGAHVETEDITQELLLWMVVHEEHVLRWRSEEDGDKPLYKSLTREAYKYCEREKAARVGYGPVDNSGYSPNTIREYLGSALQGDRAEETPEGFENISLMDIREGLGMIGDSAGVLRLAVQLGYDYEALAERLDITYEAARKRVERALVKLAQSLSEPRGYVNPWVGMARYSNQDILRAQEAG